MDSAIPSYCFFLGLPVDVAGVEVEEAEGSGVVDAVAFPPSEANDVDTFVLAMTVVYVILG